MELEQVCDDPPEYAGLLCHHLGCFSVVSQLKQSLGTLQQHLVGEEGTTITTFNSYYHTASDETLIEANLTAQLLHHISSRLGW